MKREKKDMRGEKLSFGIEWKGCEKMKIIDSVLCARR